MLLALAVDAALLIVVAEAALLLAWRRRRSAVRPLLVNLLAGLCLLLALRGALAGLAWPGLLALLAVAGLAHVAELGLRLRAAR